MNVAWTLKRIYGPAQPTSTGAVTLHTSTGGTVLKEIVLANNTTGAGTIKIGVGGVANANLVVPETYVVGKSTSEAVDNMIILALALALNSSSDTLQAQNGSSSFPITVTVSAEVNT